MNSPGYLLSLHAAQATQPHSALPQSNVPFVARWGGYLPLTSKYTSRLSLTTADRSFDIQENSLNFLQPFGIFAWSPHESNIPGSASNWITRKEESGATSHPSLSNSSRARGWGGGWETSPAGKNSPVLRRWCTRGPGPETDGVGD